MRQIDRGRRKLRTPRYRSLQSFYTADPRRVHSRERDVGLWWRDSADGLLHRAAWVCDTGELYLVRLGPTEQGGGQVEVLTTIAEEERLERVLAGWREHCGELNSLSWLRGRAARIGSRVRAKQAEVAATVTGAAAMLAAGASMAAEMV
jgi:hypothetical protein